MFNNLIESRSHTREFKRRGSFLLYTIAAYGFLFVVAGVASIYAYDAHLEEQVNEEVTMLSPIDFPAAPRTPDRQPASAPRPTNRDQTVDVRQQLVANVNHPDLVPTQISTKPNLVPPIRDGVPTMVGRDNSNGSGPPIGAPGPGTGGGGGTLVPTTVVVDPGTPPPPAPTPAPPRVVHKTRVLNSEALLLPKPIYSTLAKQAHASGTVSVQILIDEKGKVISAKSMGGHPLLVVEAIKAAYLAKFSPTIVGETPVKVSGTITYNFVLQ